MKNLVRYFLLAYSISWFIWSPLWLPFFGITGLPAVAYHHYLGSFGPAIAAFIVIYSTKGKKGIKELLSRIVKWRVPVMWYLFSTAGLLAVFIIGAFLAEQINQQSFSWKGFGTNTEFPGIGVAGYFLFNFFTFGFGEETGWRGYALPVLQNRFNALTATILLTVGWAAWHIPAFLYRPGYSSMDAAGIAGFFFSLFTGSILLTWVYNSTKGSIFVVSVFHAMIELIFISDNITPEISMYEGLIITAVAILVIFFAKPENLSKVQRQEVSAE